MTPAAVLSILLTAQHPEAAQALAKSQERLRQTTRPLGKARALRGIVGNGR